MIDRRGDYNRLRARLRSKFALYQSISSSFTQTNHPHRLTEFAYSGTGTADCDLRTASSPSGADYSFTFDFALLDAWTRVFHEPNIHQFRPDYGLSDQEFVLLSRPRKLWDFFRGFNSSAADVNIGTIAIDHYTFNGTTWDFVDSSAGNLTSSTIPQISNGGDPNSGGRTADANALCDVGVAIAFGYSMTTTSGLFSGTQLQNIINSIASYIDDNATATREPWNDSWSQATFSSILSGWATDYQTSTGATCSGSGGINFDFT